MTATEQELPRSHARLRVLAEVSQAFAAVATDYQSLIEKIARSTAELVGDGCIVTLIDADGETMFNAANAHRDRALENDYRAYLAGRGISKTTSATVSAAVVRTGEPRMAELLPGDVVDRTDEALKPLVARLNVHGFAVVPIRARLRIIGTLSLIRSGPGRSYTSEDLVLLQDMADRAGLAIENARLFADLQRTLADLRLAVQARDEFLSIASHEIKTPLTPLELELASAAELVRQARSNGSDVPLEKLESKLARAANQVERLTLLVNNLLDVTRLTSGRVEIIARDVELRAVVDAVVDRLQESIKTSGSRLTISDDGPVHGSWDPGGVESVVSNLIGNAVKYGEGRSIDVELRVVGDVARLSVVDHGIGIDPEDLERIFERFERAAPGHQNSGLGIGLWVCRQVVEAHGGRIHVSSSKGSGSTFLVEMPVARGVKAR